MAPAQPSRDKPGSSPTPDARPDDPATVNRILVLNHHRDPVDELLSRLRQSGYDVHESRNLNDTQRMLGAAEPSLVILNPLVVKHDGVEFELAKRAQRDGQPVPIILLVENVHALEEARQLDVPFRDFVMKPFSIEECVHRVQAALATRAQFMQLHSRAAELEGQVSVDHKTELLSERYFRQMLQIEFKRARRHRMPLSLMLIDVDDFKGINDSTEYAFGDEVLRHVARSLRNNVRETDFAARFGGDEFVVLLPHTTPAEAVHTAMRIKKKISTTTVASRNYAKTVTISVGIDCFDGRDESTWAELERRANKALHRAKQQGKNQVALFDVGADQATPPPRGNEPRREEPRREEPRREEPRREEPRREESRRDEPRPASAKGHVAPDEPALEADGVDEIDLSLD